MADPDLPPPPPPPGWGAARVPTAEFRANFGERLAASLVDGVLLAVVSAVLGAFLSTNSGRGVGLLLSLGYYTYFHGSPSGQTIGKRVLSIRVVDAGALTPIDYGRAALRYVCTFLSALPCLLGYLWMLWDPGRQTWHDKLATTAVVRTSAFPVDRWPG